ncbi:hypothetical protein HDU87_004753, partial [Geranomyces variabilis]
MSIPFAPSPPPPPASSQQFSQQQQTGQKQEEAIKENYIYARVSSGKQRADLDRQVNVLQLRYPTYNVITDVSSGLNFKRPGLATLLERSNQGLVGQIVFTHHDRLCRLAYDLLQKVFSLNGTHLVVVYENTQPSASGLSELVEDILGINTVYICRMQGKRSGEYRRI